MDNIEVKSNVDGLELYSENYPFRLPLRIKNFEDEASFKKFARNVESTVRHSVEYKFWRKYILDVLGVNECMITKESMSEVTLEIHHHVPSLYCMVRTLINKRIEKEQEFSTFDIALETIELHFANKVGYVTLISSIHEKFHNSCLQIPIKLVKGNYHAFLEEYSKYIDDDDMDRITSRLAVKESNCDWSKDNYPGLEMTS